MKIMVSHSLHLTVIPYFTRVATSISTTDESDDNGSQDNFQSPTDNKDIVGTM